MLTSLVCFTFAYGSMLRVLLPAACGRRLLVRLRRALLALSDVPAAAVIGCMTIAGDATFGDRNELTALEDPDALQEFQRRRSLRRGHADRRSGIGPLWRADAARPGMTVEMLGFPSLSPILLTPFFGSFHICSRLTS